MFRIPPPAVANTKKIHAIETKPFQVLAEKFLCINAHDGYIVRAARVLLVPFSKYYVVF